MEVISKLKLLGKQSQNIKVLDDSGNVMRDEHDKIKRCRGFTGIKFINDPDDCPLCKKKEKENLPK
jgi:hypothetical protein